MERVYAFIDESGAFGGDTSNPSVSKYFIITSIIIEKKNLDFARKVVTDICKNDFSGAEMKSSGIGSNSKRRLKILTELEQIPYKVFALLIDKDKIDSYKFPGFKYKKSFYKFLNQIIYSELHKTFPLIDITADSTGSSDFSESFLKYMKTKIQFGNLFEEQNIFLTDSKDEVLVQIADIISGSLMYIYDERKKDSNKAEYKRIIDNHILKIEFYPKDYKSFKISESAVAAEYDTKIAEICFHSAKEFLDAYERSKDEESIIQKEVVEYLLFRFMNNNQRHYISTKEILDFLHGIGHEDISAYFFRTQIIAKLRDFGVIIASSTKGYKIPTNQQDLLDFVEHTNTIVIPMLSRLKKGIDKIKIGTLNEVDLLKEPKYEELRNICATLQKEKF